MKRIPIFLGIVVLSSLLCWGFSVTRGTGPPDIRGWCPADWLVGCSSGTAALSPDGLFLSNLIGPPRSAYELELKLIPYQTLLFVFQGQQDVGHVVISIDGIPLETVPVEAGTWWVCLDDLPAEGTLRLELDDYCDGLLLRSIYFPCQYTAPLCPDCRDAQFLGFLLGALLTATLLLLAYLFLWE